MSLRLMYLMTSGEERSIKNSGICVPEFFYDYDKQNIPCVNNLATVHIIY